MTPRIAVVHEWLLDYAGSERVVREILEVLPDADLFALIDRPDDELRARDPAPRPRHDLPAAAAAAAQRWLRYYLPLMPLAVGGLDVSAYDLVISSSHAVAKGVRTGTNQLHVSYVHTPMRYAWDLRDEYLRAAGLDRGLRGWAARFTLERLRRWDARSADGVDVFLANSPLSPRASASPTAGTPRCSTRRSTSTAFRAAPEKEDFYLTRRRGSRRTSASTCWSRRSPRSRAAPGGHRRRPRGRPAARAWRRPTWNSRLGCRQRAVGRLHAARARLPLRRESRISAS